MTHKRNWKTFNRWQYPITLQCKALCFVLLIAVPNSAVSQNEKAFINCYNILDKALSSNEYVPFKDLVFEVENAYQEGSMSKPEFDKKISAYSKLAILTKESNKTTFIYTKKDFEKILTYASVFKVITDTTEIVFGKDTLFNLPLTYDFDDIFGIGDWRNMFVSKLLVTGQGNCHSLPYLYKMICDELKVPCHLALAPNHVYIKHRAEKGGWYNTELTSGSFPMDAWLMASGYISLEAVQKGIYLDTLSEKESIALCVLDLAQGYNHKYPDNDGKFVIECCDLALKHFPDYVNAILLKAETP